MRKKEKLEEEAKGESVAKKNSMSHFFFFKCKPMV